MATYQWSIPTGKAITGLTYIKDTDNNIADTINDLVDFVNGEGNHAGQGLTYDMVDRLSIQTITGAKTFSSPITGSLIGNVTGNVTGNTSGSSSKLATPRNINLIGDVTGTVSFDGTTDVNMTTSYNTEVFPTGGIIMWSGTIATIPSGWSLCDGTNGTPNLTDRFIIGAGTTYNPADTGGSADAIVVAHTHNASTDAGGQHRHGGYSNLNLNYSNGGGRPNDAPNGYATSGRYWQTLDAGLHTHSVNIDSSGSDATNANLPPYYALAFIMKV